MLSIIFSFKNTNRTLFFFIWSLLKMYLTYVLYAFIGANACIQLKKYDEANALYDKGLEVSFTGIDTWK